MESRNSFREYNDDLVEYIVDILQWSCAIDIISKGVTIGGLTEPYQQGLPKLQNYIWNWWQQDMYQIKRPNQLSSNLLVQEKNRWIFHARKNNPNGFSQLVPTPLKLDDFEKHILFILHLVDEERAKDDVEANFRIGCTSLESFLKLEIKHLEEFRVIY